MEKERKETIDIKSLVPELIAIPIGLFHLNRGDRWGCMFVSDKCMEILECTMADFLDRLMEIEVVSLMDTPEKTVGMLLEKMKRTHEGGAFVGIRQNSAGETQYIRGNLSVSMSADGRLRVYGQITDSTAACRQERSGRKAEEQVEEKAEEQREQIYQIVAGHSNRILYGYDLKTCTTRPWDKINKEKDILGHLYKGSYSQEEVGNNPFVLPDSIEEVKNFFASIHQGIPTGESNIHLKLENGEPRWYHFKYSSLFSGGKPETALISIMDVTEHHEQELAYRRYVQTLEQGGDGLLMYIESDLSDDRIEKLAGQMLSGGERNVQCSHTDFGRMLLEMKFTFEEDMKANQYFSCKNLLKLYSQGEKQLKSEWEVRFKDDTLHWLEIHIMLMDDPYNGHVKAFFSMRDFTEEREERMAILKRAELDAMTGLFRKGAGEEKIRQCLAQSKGKGGILLAIDLDDLKGINDSLGHKQGDAAIIGIAETLKSHFRKDDILVRSGGDEFVVYLPGAGGSEGSVGTAIVSLLQKLSATFIGENKERGIHCSIGCAVEKPGRDSYDTLFKRADTALYHVKRSGKNNYAFFEPAMLEADYQFKLNQAVPMVNKQKGEKELKELLGVVASRYPGVVRFNLSKNEYCILSLGNNAEKMEPRGSIDAFWESWSGQIHPEDKKEVLMSLSRDNLLNQYTKGRQRVAETYRGREDAGYKRMQVKARFYRNEEGDIGAFLFFRRGNKKAGKK